MNKKEELMNYLYRVELINERVNVDILYEDIISIIDPPSIIKVGGKSHMTEYTFDTESELYDWYKRITELSPSIDMKTFYEIIHQSDFTIEGYEISKGISIENEKQMDKKLLQRRYDDLM